MFNRGCLNRLPLLLFRLSLNRLFIIVLNRYVFKKITKCCIFLLIVTNITKIANALQNYIFFVWACFRSYVCPVEIN